MFCCLPFGHQTNFQTKEAPSLRADPYENINRTRACSPGAGLVSFEARYGCVQEATLEMKTLLCQALDY